MSLYFASLNSGSNGNCYYVGNSHEAVLVDVGISCREVEKRLARLSLDIRKIKAIFISHEHSDHIKGVEVLSRKFKLPVYITGATLKHSGMFLQEDLRAHFSAYCPVTIGNLSVLAFPKLHDASDPHSFVVSGNGLNVGVFTDIGKACEHVITNFKQCHAVFLEANYDETMLEVGNYPFYLKKRIRSHVGHLSNDQALDLYLKHKPVFMTHVLLSHLSKENNNVELVHTLFKQRDSSSTIVVASRDSESEVYTIGGNLDHQQGVMPGSKTPKQTTLF
ncbi:MAG: MBL fold metallo-hydrolase [bacterium]|nr:MBL fold metallo-hydrolase [bacterium]